jgi:phosphatidylinositol dimannoside acyltransferase
VSGPNHGSDDTVVIVSATRPDGEPYRGTGHPGAAVDRNPGAAQRIPHTEREGVRLRLSGLGWKLLWEVARRLPEPVAFGLFAAAAPVFRLVATQQRARLRANLGRVRPDASPEELDRLVAEGFRSYARYFVEAFRAADITVDDMHRRTVTSGFEHLDAALERGRGVVVLLAHHGSWDLAARWAESHGYHLAVVAEVVRPRALFEKFVRLRETVGLEVVPLRRGDDVKGRLTEVLRANHMVGLLSDRDLTGKGPVVDLYGEPVRLPPGPVLLARRTGAALVPITMRQLPGRRWHLQALPEIDVASGSLDDAYAAMARGIEALVDTDPSQWHALSPVWLAEVPAHRRGDLPAEVDARLREAS